MKEEKSRLGCVLQNYTRPRSSSYDPEFDKQIKELAPHWFTTVENKKKLIEMAKRGEPRPMCKSKLKTELTKFLGDSEFNKQIRKLAPHWFARSE
jgi:hypothetical protein